MRVLGRKVRDASIEYPQNISLLRIEKTRYTDNPSRVVCCGFVHVESYTVKPVLSGHSKIDKTQILMTNGSLMKVESIAECSLEHSAILLTFIKR